MHLAWVAGRSGSLEQSLKAEQWLCLLFVLVSVALQGFEGTFAFPSQIWAISGLVGKKQNSFLIECSIQGGETRQIDRYLCNTKFSLFLLLS